MVKKVNRKKLRLSLKEVFLKEMGDMSKLQGTHKSTPRNVYVPDTTQNLVVTQPARMKTESPIEPDFADDSDLEDLVYAAKHEEIQDELNSTDDLGEQEVLSMRAENEAADINNLGREAQMQYLSQMGHEFMPESVELEECGGEGSCGEGACPSMDPEPSPPEMPHHDADGVPDVIVIKLGHHAEESHEQGEPALNIGRVGAPGGPDLDQPAPINDPLAHHDILYDDEVRSEMYGEAVKVEDTVFVHKPGELPGHQSLDTVRWEQEHNQEESDPGRPEDDNDDDNSSGDSVNESKDPDDKKKDNDRDYDDEEGEGDDYSNDWKSRVGITETLGAAVGEDDLGF
jgi:hypothetical protein